MLTLTAGNGGVVQLLTVVVIFVFVLAITYLSTKWLANYQKGRSVGSNIEVIETYRLTVNKYVQIVRIGNKYLAIAVGKDEVTFLTELNHDDLHLPEVVSGTMPDFASVLEKIKKLKK
ncbi:MAG: flagellar biosynthetic protein FliO [Lachnospiraceae bacterium]|jgi:flagellar protein FliO/FliZ|nr:flagellar biosynthetic protein FliO [Lachnospiraceae bacterium]